MSSTPDIWMQTTVVEVQRAPWEWWWTRFRASHQGNELGRVSIPAWSLARLAYLNIGDARYEVARVDWTGQRLQLRREHDVLATARAVSISSDDHAMEWEGSRFELRADRSDARRIRLWSGKRDLALLRVDSIDRLTNTLLVIRNDVPVPVVLFLFTIAFQIWTARSAAAV